MKIEVTFDELKQLAMSMHGGMPAPKLDLSDMALENDSAWPGVTFDNWTDIVIHKTDRDAWVARQITAREWSLVNTRFLVGPMHTTVIALVFLTDGVIWSRAES